ncbi:uncharacterized protein LOC135120633 [Zophobas morio]|uniref:uncharacterized protein LOC135120633 n=1 Tax=Zophobas morio TaxID=2755281 RepID=UPI00308303F4
MNCEECGSGKFIEVDNGFKVCVECGTHLRGYQAITDEEYICGSLQQRRGRKVKGKTHDSLEASLNASLQDDYITQLKRLLKVLQSIIQLQVKALISFGCTTALEDSAKGIWTVYIASFENGMHDEFLAKLQTVAGRGRSSCLLNDASALSEDGGKESYLSTTGKSTTAESMYSLSPNLELTLVVVYLGVLYLHIPLTALDFCETTVHSMALKNAIPFYDSCVDHPEFRLLHPTHKQRLLKKNVLTSRYLHKRTTLVAKKLGLSPPPLNFLPLAYRYARKLMFPSAIAQVAHVLHQKSGVDRCLRVTSPPRVIVIACLIIAVKLCYGSECEYEYGSDSFFEEVAGPFSWASWLRKIYQKSFSGGESPALCARDLRSIVYKKGSFIF